MKLLITLFLVFISSLVFCQNSTFRSKLNLSPHIGIGWALPPFIDGRNSDLVLKSVPLKNFVIAEIIKSSGTPKKIFKITNTIGLDANYTLSSKWSTNIGVNRAMQVNLLNDPNPIKVSTTTIYRTWVFAYKYTSFTFGLRYHQHDTFFQCNFHYAGNAKRVIESDNGSAGGGGVSSNGNGIVTSIMNRNGNTFLISPEYGVAGISSFDLPMELSVGLHIPTTIFSKQNATFIRNNLNVGENTLSFTQAALWLRARIPITVWTKQSNNNKVILLNPSMANTFPEQSVEYEGKRVALGEKVILTNLQFEQTKAILNIAAMAELDEVKELMSDSPTMVIEIIGHTSDEGDRNSNIELSLKRAKECKEYLIKKGINANRIKIKGMGPDAPISTTDKSQNRRVEMKIIKL